MGKASISIAVTGSYNGAALERAESRLDSMSKKVAGASKNMNVAGREMVESGAKLANAGGEIYNTGAKIESAGNKMMGVTAAVVGVGVATGAAAIKIDTALTGVRKTVDGTDEQYNQLKESAIEFSKTNAVSADQILDIQALGAQLGFSIDELDEFSRVVSGLDIATDMDAETAATQLAQFSNIVGMSHDKVSNYGSAIVNLGNHMATTESSISNMAQRTAAASHQIGMTEPEILGWSAAMSSLGIDAEAGGTAFSTTVSTIDAAVATGGDSLDAFAKIAGMSADEFRDSWKRSATDTMLALLKGTDGAENMTLALESMGVTGIRQTDVLKRLAGNTDLVSQALDVSNQGWQENTALTAEVENRNSSMASKLEILQNKLTAIAEDIGTPLVGALTDAIDAAEPLIQSVEQVSTGFSNMDKGSQQVVIGLAAATAAAGPFLKVTGSIVKGAGSMVTAFGKAKQDIGTYADALTTTDAAALKAYSSNDKLSGALKSNPAAKAAGGVDKYVQAVQNANRDTSQYERAVRNLSNEQKKGSKANQELVANLQKEVDEKKSAMDASTSLVSGYQEEAAGAAASTAATKAHAIGLGVLSAAANVAKVALATIAPMAIMAGITLLVTKFQEAKQHADNLAEATSGLEGAASGATNEVNNEASAFDLLTGNAGKAKVDVDGMLESQAQLAQTMRETNTNAAAQQTQLQNAYTTIQQYANQSDLSTEAQGRLRSAVETVNDMCGTQISVTDAANGKLADENGAIDNVTGALGDYISKKLEQIKVDAQQENLTALYKQQAEDIQTVAKAQKAYNDKLNEHDQYVKNYIATCGPYVQNVEQMAEAAWQGTLAQSDEAKALDESKAALDSCNSSIDNVTASLGATAAAATGAATNIGTIAQASPVVSTAIDAVGGDLTDFSNDLSDAGVSVSEFNSLSQDQLIQLASSWDGTSASIVSTLDGMGVQMQDKGLSAVTALSSGMASGRVSVEASTEVIKAAATGDWSGVASLMQQNGINIPKSVSKGISDGSYQPTAETSAMISAVALQLSGGDVEKAAELLGHDIDAGLAQAIQDNNTDVLTNTYGLTQDTIDKAREGFQTHSPSVVFQEIGGDLDAGLANGIDSNSDGPLTSIGNLVQGIIDALNPLSDSSTNTGSSASSGLAGGLLSNLGLVSGNAALLESGAENGVSGTPGTFSSTGTSAGSLFAQTIGSFFGATTQSGLSLASGASTGVSGTPGALGSTGRQAGANFASGIGSGQGSTSSSARGLGSSAQNGVSGTPGALGSAGRSASSQFASGVGSGQGSTAASAAALAAAARRMTDVGDMHSSGSHLASNFAAGIRAGLGWVSSAANAIANAAKSILGFSVPDEGPWSGAEKGGALSGEHLAKNFAAGMLSGTADVRDAALRLAADASIDGYGFGAGSGRPNRTAVTNNYYSMGNVTIDASSIKEFMTMDEFFRFMRRAKAGA